MRLLSYNETGVAVEGITGWEPLYSLVVLFVVGSSTMSMSPYVPDQTRSLCSRMLVLPFPPVHLALGSMARFRFTYTPLLRNLLLASVAEHQALRCGRVAFLVHSDDR
jgi:hypothetical protein